MALPSGYTQLRYIQSSGTQYINTGFNPNQNTRVTISFEPTVSVAWRGAFGARNGTNIAEYAIDFSDATKIRSMYGTEGMEVTVPSMTSRFEVDKNKNTCTINGTVLTHTAQTFQATCPMHLFSKNTTGTAWGVLAMKLYSCQIYDNGTLIRDFVPAKNSGGTVGLYDTVNGVFYTNAGNGTFTAGPSVTGPVDGEGAVILAGVSFAIKEGTAMLNGVARKITEGMTMLNGAAKKIAVASGINVAAMVIGYTGAYTDQPEVTMSGKKYRMLTLTGSGTLTVDAEVKADVWMCGGGAGGAGGDGGAYGDYCCGGAGAYTAESYGITLDKNGIVATVGAGSAGVSGDIPLGASATSFGNIKTNTVKGKNGGTGGGGGTGAAPGGKGDGVNKHPFSDSTAFLDPCCGGGGGGHLTDNEEDEDLSGGNGGTNGGDGGVLQAEKGGVKGGGNGGVGSYGSGSAATYYGSGGGAGAFFCTSKGSVRGGSGGAGYQGVIYVRIPYEQ